jgi:hypothetical protein
LAANPAAVMGCFDAPAVSWSTATPEP